jgi:hypothetical protein
MWRVPVHKPLGVRGLTRVARGLPLALVTRRHFDRVRCTRRPDDLDISRDDGSGSIDVVAGGWSRGLVLNVWVVVTGEYALWSPNDLRAEVADLLSRQ